MVVQDGVRLALRGIEEGKGSHSAEDCFPILTMEEIPSKPLTWVWNGFVPRGKVTLIAGEPGVGKSLLALQVATMVTLGVRSPIPLPKWARNGEFPGEDYQSDTGPGAVVLYSGEDDLADTVRPRLEAAGADLSRIYLMGGLGRSGTTQRRTFELDRDLPMLEAGLERLREKAVDVQLVVIDGLVGVEDAAKDLTEERVGRLVEFAAASGAAVLVIANCASAGILKKRRRGRIVGCEELAHAARSVLMVVEDLEHEQQRLVLPWKTNLCEMRPGLAFGFREGRVEWQTTPVSLTGNEYMNQAREKLKNPLVREECTEIQRVTNFLEEQLHEGARPSVVVRAAAYEHEVAYSTLRRAFGRLGCRAYKHPENGRWYWRLPGRHLFDVNEVYDSKLHQPLWQQ